MDDVPGAPLGRALPEEHTEGFIAELGELGYSPRSFEAQLRLLRHLSAWLATRGLTTDALTDEVVRTFVADRRQVTTNMRSERALAPLLRHLIRALGVAPEATPKIPSTPAEALLERFGSFLSSEKSLAPETVRSYLSLVQPFVIRHIGRAGGWKSLAPSDVDEFILARAGTDRSGSVAVRANALRALLRWMWREHLVGASLSDAVGRFAARNTTLGPAALDKEEVARLITALSEEPPARVRDEAMLLLLLRLGLRGGEVASLRLDDLDWRAAVMRVRGKRGRVDELPLPTDVGAKLGAYLHEARPSGTSHREVFLGLDAPHGPITRAAVTSVVARARDRAGIEGPGAAHRLRHTAACSVLASGGGLAEVAQLLRHEHPSASARYARSDLNALAVLARPWPSEAVR